MAWTQKNTEGYTDAELEAINAAIEVVAERRFGTSEDGLESASDAVNNATNPDQYPATAEELEAATPFMEEGIRERLHMKLAPCKPALFGMAYALAHQVILGQPFAWRDGHTWRGA